VLLLNASAAFAACCLDKPGETVASEMPCHDQKDSTDRSMPDDCCVVCVSMLAPESDPDLLGAISHDYNVQSAREVFSNEFSPPFRPPIHKLS